MCIPIHFTVRGIANGFHCWHCWGTCSTVLHLAQSCIQLLHPLKSHMALGFLQLFKFGGGFNNDLPCLAQFSMAFIVVDDAATNLRLPRGLQYVFFSAFHGGFSLVNSSRHKDLIGDIQSNMPNSKWMVSFQRLLCLYFCCLRVSTTKK